VGKRGRGEGSIFRRKDGRWSAVLDLGVVDGRRQRHTVYGATQQEVLEKLAEAKRRGRSGEPLKPARMTVDEYLDQWLEGFYRPTVEAATYKNREHILRNHVRPALGKIRLSELTEGAVQRLLNATAREGYAVWTVDRIYGVLKLALDHAVQRGLIPRNVAKLAKVPRAEARPPREAVVLTFEQILQLFKATQDSRMRAVYIVASVLGLRRGEIFGLQWSRVRFEEGKIEVSKALRYAADGKLELAEPKGRLTAKRRASKRTIPLPDFVAKALQEHRARQNEERLRIGSLWQDQGYVFTKRDGSPYPPNWIDGRFKKALQKAGLPLDAHFHDLRHTCATLLTELGVPLRTIMAILGHAQLSMTLYYSHTSNEQYQHASKMLDGLFQAGP
jgi:integrase